MNGYEIKVIDPVSVEPLSLEEVKARLGIDQDYAHNDNDLEILITAARERLEQYTGIAFTPRKIMVQFASGKHELPLGPVITPADDIVVTDTDGDVIDKSKYRITGLEFLKIHLGSCGRVEFFYPINGGTPEVWSSGTSTDELYNVVYETGYQCGRLPLGLKNAMLAQIDYMFKAEGSEQMQGISPYALQLCKGYSRNLVIQ